MAKYRNYKKDLDYSYTLGIFLTIELIKQRPKDVLSVILSSETEESSGIKKITELCKIYHISLEINDKLISMLSPKENCYAIGIFSKYEEKLLTDENHIVLVNPSDSGNLGTIIRTGLGFDIKNIAIIKPGVDIFDPKTIRASMGSLFHIRFEYFSSFDEYAKIHDHDMYPFMLKAKKKIQDVTLNNKPFSLIFGNEARGLDDYFLNVGTSVIIPHSNLIDSLNLSVATAIALYEFNNKLINKK